MSMIGLSVLTQHRIVTVTQTDEQTDRYNCYNSITPCIALYAGVR